jgi:alkylation response protein AidB-like acyl-CoA dehydrogenase
VVDAMIDAGLFRIWKPKQYGGWEMDPITALEFFEELSSIESAVGWNLQLTGGIDLNLQVFSDKGVDEIFSSAEEVIMAGTFQPPGQAIPVEGGYRVSGHWKIATGCQYANWFMGNAMVMDGAEMRTHPDGSPFLIFVVFPAHEAEVIESWNTIGLRGTGSHDFKAGDIFVPEYRSAPMVPIEQAYASAFKGPLYRNPLWYVVAALAPVALGIARAAIEEFVDLAKNKTPHLTTTTLQDKSIVQRRIGEAQAQYEAGRAYLHETIKETWVSAQAGKRMTLHQQMKLNSAAIFAIKASSEAVSLIHEVAGLSAVRDSYRFQKHWRDVHTITQHAYTSTLRYESIGQLMLGLPPEWPFFYF